MAKKDLETLPNWRDAFNSPTTVRNQRTKDNVGILLYAYTPVLVIFQDVTKSLFGWPAKQFDCVIELYGTLGPISLLELLTAVRTISSAFFQIMMVWMNFCIIWYDIAVIPGAFKCWFTYSSTHSWWWWSPAAVSAEHCHHHQWMYWHLVSRDWSSQDL